MSGSKITNYNYLYMAITLARSLREVGYEEDIVAITNHEPYKETLLEEGIKVEFREVFNYPALHHFKCQAWPLSRFDMAKVHYWSLWQYNRVVCLDCDILAGTDDNPDAKFTDWDRQDTMINWGGVQSTINSSMMCITPSHETYTSIRQLLRTATFSPESGWNGCGPLKQKGWATDSWRFQAANAAQGFIPFYFDGSLTTYPWRLYFRHFAGRKKYEDYYVSELKKHGFTMNKPKWFE